MAFSVLLPSCQVYRAILKDHGSPEENERKLRQILSTLNLDVPAKAPTCLPAYPWP